MPRRTMSVRFTPVMRPVHPTRKRSSRTPITRRVSARASARSGTRLSSSIPRRMTVNFEAGATPSATSSSRTSGLTATSASVTRASIRSSIRKTTVQNRPKYPRSTWPWNVCTTIGGRARPASSAADAADRARLRGVRVQDRRPVGSHHLGEADGREQVLHRRDLAVQVRDRHDLDAEAVGDVGHRLLAVADRARRRASCRSLASARPLGQVRDVERRPAHVQPRDHAEDADPVRQGTRRCGGGLPRARPWAPSRAPRGRR